MIKENPLYKNLYEYFENTSFSRYVFKEGIVTKLQNGGKGYAKNGNCTRCLSFIDIIIF
jgi:hypothetical protein